MIQKLYLRQNLEQKMQLKLIGEIKVAEFLSLPEPYFEFYVKEVENDPLFSVLKEKYRIVSYRKFYDVRVAKKVELKDEAVPEENLGEMEKFFSDPSLMKFLTKVGNAIGEEDFRKVLYGKISLEEVKKKCGFSSREMEIFKEFLNNFQLHQIINSSSFSFSVSPFKPRLFLVASFVWEKDELFIQPTGEYLAKGRYQINYKRFEELVEKGKIKKEEVSRIEGIFKKIEMINRRTTCIYKVLEYLKKLQFNFFKSGNPIDLLPSTQSEVARRIGVHPSTVNRCISNKSILTPQGEEKPIGFFFSPRWAKNLVKKVILEEKEKLEKNLLSSPLTDKLIQEKIIEDYGIHLSRRTVCKYRKALRIPASYKRCR